MSKPVVPSTSLPRQSLLGVWRKANFVAMTSTVMLLLAPSSLLLTVVEARDCAKSWRRDWRDLTCEQQDQFLQAVVDLKVSGTYDEFVFLHEALAAQTHFTPLFLPWHRWFIWQFEKALQDVTGECIYLPYWSWERDSGNEGDASVWHPETFGSYTGTSEGDCIQDGIASGNRGPFRWSLGIDNGPDGCVQRTFAFAGTGVPFSGESEILAMLSNYNQYADTAGSGGLNGFASEFELGPHTLVHGIIGGHMETNWSPADPLFFLHHSNVDRIWTMWQDYWDQDWYDPEEYESPWHFEGRGMDDRMPFSNPEVWWDFRMVDEEGNRWYPSPREVMSNEGPYMSVRYQNDFLSTLLPGYEPNPNLFQPAKGRVRVTCRDRGWNDWWSRTRDLTSEGSKSRNQTRSEDFEEEIQSKRENDVLLQRGFLQGDESQEFMAQEQSQQKEEEIKLAIPEHCQLKNKFSRQSDQDKWDRLCRELPPTTSVAELFARVAEEDCAERGNPLSVTEQTLERMQKMMNVKPQAFECFHRPDRSARH